MKDDPKIMAIRELVKLAALRTDSAILLLMAVSDSLTITGISGSLQLEDSTVSMATRRLRQSGMISLTQPLADPRQVMPQLSELGQRRVLELRAALSAIVTK